MRIVLGRGRGLVVMMNRVRILGILLRRKLIRLLLGIHLRRLVGVILRGLG